MFIDVTLKQFLSIFIYCKDNGISLLPFSTIIQGWFKMQLTNQEYTKVGLKINDLNPVLLC